MLIDTHAHLDFENYNSDRDEVIGRAVKNGVEKIINIGCNLKRAEFSLELAQKYDNIYATVGIHPEDVTKDELRITNQELRKLAANKKVVAIGECGLDYFHVKDEGLKNKQKELFELQIKIANELKLPLVIHCRDAFGDILEIIKNYKFEKGAVLHCFTGDPEIAKKFLALGCYISFTGIITFVKPKDALLEAIRAVPIEKLMIETDCPFLSPMPHRGKRNEPAYVKYVAEKIATVKNISISEVEKITTKNAIKFFKLPT